MQVKREMKHKEIQKNKERVALNILTDKLLISRQNITESESPDFIFKYEGKIIGAEVVEYHRSKKVTEARKAFQKALDNYKGKEGKLTSLTIFAENIFSFNKKKMEQQLFNEINGLMADNSYDSEIIQSADEWEVDSESELPVSTFSIGVCQHVDKDILQEIIRSKEEKLSSYKSLHKEIDDFWLIVFIDWYEYDYFKKMEKPQIRTLYNRIYLTHIFDGVLRIK